MSPKTCRGGGGLRAVWKFSKKSSVLGSENSLTIVFKNNCRVTQETCDPRNTCVHGNMKLLERWDVGNLRFSVWSSLKIMRRNLDVLSIVWYHTVQFVLNGLLNFLFDFPESDWCLLPVPCLEFTLLVFDCFLGLVLCLHRGLICFESLVGFCTLATFPPSGTFITRSATPSITLNVALLVCPPSGPDSIIFWKNWYFVEN